MRRISSLEDVEAGLAALAGIDPGLAPVIEAAGEVPLRLRSPGFEGLARIVVGQQVSVASADAIWRRFAAALPEVEAAAIDVVDDELLQRCGLSRPKIRTLRAVADAVLRGGLDLADLAEAPPEAAERTLVAIPGIGPWTAEIYLLFCAGHPDIFPAGDLALQSAVRDALAMEERPRERVLRELAGRWSPWRGVAARLFWAYYRVQRAGRQALPV